MKRWFLILSLVVVLGVLGAWWFYPANVRYRFEARRASYLKRQQSDAEYQKWRIEFTRKTRRAARIFAGANKVETFRLIDFLAQSIQPPNAAKIDGFFYSYKGTDRIRTLRGDWVHWF